MRTAENRVALMQHGLSAAIAVSNHLRTTIKNIQQSLEKGKGIALRFRVQLCWREALRGTALKIN
jgi:hypothetical protein